MRNLCNLCRTKPFQYWVNWACFPTVSRVTTGYNTLAVLSFPYTPVLILNQTSVLHSNLKKND